MANLVFIFSNLSSFFEVEAPAVGAWVLSPGHAGLLEGAPEMNQYCQLCNAYHNYVVLLQI